MASPPTPPRRTTLLSLARKRLSASQGEGGAMTERVTQRALGVLDRLDGVAATLQRVADLQVRILEGLEPVVDDLKEMVRIQLDEARAGKGLAPKGAAPSDAEPVIIDVDATDLGAKNE